MITMQTRVTAMIFLLVSCGVGQAGSITYSVSGTAHIGSTTGSIEGTLTGKYTIDTATMAISSFNLTFDDTGGNYSGFTASSASGGTYSSFTASSYYQMFFKGSPNTNPEVILKEVSIGSPSYSLESGSAVNVNGPLLPLTGTIAEASAVPEPQSLLMSIGALCMVALILRHRDATKATGASDCRESGSRDGVRAKGGTQFEA